MDENEQNDPSPSTLTASTLTGTEVGATGPSAVQRSGGAHAANALTADDELADGEDDSDFAGQFDGDDPVEGEGQVPPGLRSYAWGKGYRVTLTENGWRATKVS